MGTATNSSLDYYYISRFLHNETRLQEQREEEGREGGGE
jgi:DNA-binding response OmpR family regulator